jgi:hypothetical protein
MNTGAFVESAAEKTSAVFGQTPAGEGILGRQPQRAAGDRGEPGRIHPARQEPALDPRRQGERRSDAEFPRAGERHVEGEGLVQRREPQAGEQTRRREQQDRDDEVPAQVAVQDEQHQRPCDIELFLHPERPGVEQGHEARCRVEVAGVPVEMEVGRAQHSVGSAGADLAQFPGAEKVVLQHQRRGDDHDERGENAAYPPVVECQQGEAPAVHLRDQQGRDQVSGYHEEDVDADEAAGKRHAVVEHQHRDDRDRSQPVNVRTILQRTKPLSRAVD